jgi:TonB-dependent receptor
MTPQVVDEVVVTSIRQSLKSSQQLKQSSEIIGDSITAEDIGALPDRSVTEALQRVPGVSINRFAAGVDPDHFSVEGSGVVVRGLNFVRSELNGRDTFSANNGRSLSFADVPSELMGGVDVFKSPSADQIEGGISGTVNLRTRLPFDSKKRILSLSAEASYGDLAKKWSPTYSFLYSDRFDTADRRVRPAAELRGLQASPPAATPPRSRTSAAAPTWASPPATAAMARRACGSRAARPSAAPPPTASAKARRPPSSGAATTTPCRPRSSICARNRARSGPNTRSKSPPTTSPANGDSRAVAGTTFGYDDRGVFTNGTITGTTGWRADQNGPDPRTPIDGLQSNNVRRDVDQTYLTSDYGFNFKWTPNENWGVLFDAQHVDSKVNNLDVGLWASTFQNAQITLNGNGLPSVNFLAPSNGQTISNCAPFNNNCPSYDRAPHASLSDPYNSFWRSAMDHIEQSEGTEDALKVDVEYKFNDDTWFDSVKAGVRWSERDQTTRFSSYNWGVVSEIWGEGGPVWMTDKIDGIPDPNAPGTTGTDSLGKIEIFGFDNFLRGKVALPTGSEPRNFYAQNIVKDYAAFSAFALSIGDEWRPRLAGGCPQNWVPMAQRCGVVAGTPFRPGEINPVNEVNKAFYGMLRFGGTVSDDVRITGNVGLRYTSTKRTASGYITFPTSIPSSDASCADALTQYLALPDPKPAFVPSAFCGLTPAVRQQVRNFNNGAVIADTKTVTQDYWLPSLNVKVALPNKVQLRLGLSKTITPPDIGLVRNYYNIALDTNATGILNGIVGGNTTVGNPLLKPTQSKNVDASVEWYFAPVGSLTFAAFYKRLTDVAANTTAKVPFTNNGATFDVTVTTPGNSDQAATVKGFEIGYQQFYDFLPKPLDGFGINANFSYIDSKGVPQSTLSSTDPDVGAGRVSTVDTSKLPLQGLSKYNANFAAIYEKGPISARLAYNWRSDFLLTVRDVIVPYAPIMNEATGQLDGSFFYTVTPKMKVGVQGVNLLNETTKTTQILNSDLLKTGRSWFMSDRRYTFVVRASF